MHGAQLFTTPPPVFRARSNAATAIAAAGTPTKVNLQVEDFDPNNCFSASRFQPTVPGYYQINGAVSAGGVTTYLIAQIAKNGAVQTNGVYVLTGGTAGLISAVSDVVYLNGTTDYVELFVQVGTAISTAATDNFLSGGWLRP